MTELQKKLTEAIWVARTLYDRGKVTGSAANLSFRHDDILYITASGTCFGRLAEDDFVRMSREGRPLDSRPASKEFPLHCLLYQKSEEIGAVLHTHSPFATLWSCLKGHPPQDGIPTYTPYLKMKLGNIGMVPYEKPGTQKLFDAFRQALGEANGYLLAHHGPIVAADTLLEAFYCHEELEESARIAWYLRSVPEQDKGLISL